MAEYLHGAYGQIQAVGSRVSDQSQMAICYIGTAPVHQVQGGGENVNKPILVSNISEARRKLGYSDDFASFTLCEAMNAHFNLNGVGPLIFINVLDPKKHVKEQSVSKTLTPSNGKVTLVEAENVVADSITVKSGASTKVVGKDYSIAYNADKKTITISEARKGGLGTAELTITYQEIDPAAVTTDDIIGASDGYGLNSGVYVIQNVYQQTGFIPSFFVAPGFSCEPAVHSAMIQASQKINGHWDCYVLSDIPIVDVETEITMETAYSWKKANGYTNENETVYFPMAEGSDGHKYHLSTLAAANLQTLLSQQDGIPYRTASNTACGIIKNLWVGESGKGRIYDDGIINEALNQNGIASAAFVGGRWVIWGAHSADYDQENWDSINVAETNRMMLYYLTNDFQHRRTGDIDQPMTANNLRSIAAEEQERVDALVTIGALVFGQVELDMKQDDDSDLLSGDFAIRFRVTTTPLAKSLTASVSWTEEGFQTYVESFDAD